MVSISCVRDGLRFNPGEASLYWELGWLFQHKIGQDLDQAHAYYKQQLADSVALYLPGGRHDDLELLDRAAVDEPELLATPGMAAWLDEQQSQGVDVWDPGFLERVSDSPEAYSDLVGTPQGSNLVMHLRRVGMESTFHMDPEIMLDLDDRYGPLDWRLPQAHAIYWAQQGTRHAEKPFDRLRLKRMTFQSMAHAFLSGHAFYDLHGQLTPTPNLDILPNLQRVYDEAAAAQPDDSSVHTARLNFLRRAVLTLHTYNHLSQAKTTYEQMITQYPEAAHPAGLEGFLVATWVAQADGIGTDEALVMVESTLIQAYWSYALGDAERSKGLTLQAEIGLATLHARPGERRACGTCRVTTVQPDQATGLAAPDRSAER